MDWQKPKEDKTRQERRPEGSSSVSLLRIFPFFCQGEEICLLQNYLLGLDLCLQKLLVNIRLPFLYDILSCDSVNGKRLCLGSVHSLAGTPVLYD